MPDPSGRILAMDEQVLRSKKDGEIKFTIKHTAYADGGELYEVHSMDGKYQDAKFRLHSQLVEWLRKRGFRV